MESVEKPATTKYSIHGLRMILNRWKVRAIVFPIVQVWWSLALVEKGPLDQFEFMNFV